MDLGDLQVRDDALDFLNHGAGAHHQIPVSLPQVGIQVGECVGQKDRPVRRHRAAAQDRRVEHEQRHDLGCGATGGVQHGIVVHPQITGEQRNRHGIGGHGRRQARPVLAIIWSADGGPQVPAG
jgi:hypothetical protein